MKYVMMHCKSSGSLPDRMVPLIFPDFLVHRDMAFWFKHYLLRYHLFSDVQPRSAGEYNSMSGECSGGSETLNLTAHELDGAIIATYEYMHGIVT